MLSTPRITVSPSNPEMLNREFSFIVEAYSKSEYDPGIKQLCTFEFKFMVVPNDSLLVWPTGRHLPDTFYSNYPGQLFIDLDRFVLGANITYGIQIGKGKDGLDPPVHFILQQNDTNIVWWDKKPSMFKYTFLRMEQFDSRDETELWIYSQDYDNATHLSRCITVPYTDEVHCIESGHAPHINFRIDNLTATRFHYYGGQYLHLAAILYEEFPNEVFVYDVESGAELGTRPIMFPSGYEGKVQAVEFIGHYMAVVLRFVKEIVFFDMRQCFDHQERECEEIYRIDSIMMDKLGVEYFSPMDIKTSDFHPYVLFIQCLDRVIILDIAKSGPILLEEIRSPSTKEPGPYRWKMAIAKGELLIVNPPNLIEEFNLDELYTFKNTEPTKIFPTFKYTIPDTFDLDFSDNGNLVYITAVDPDMSNQTNSVILVYRTGYPAVSSLYDVFHLNLRYDELHIDATGNFGDYIAVAWGSVLSMFRQYEDPIVVIEDSFDDYKFNVTYTNEPQHSYKYFSSVEVKIANFPEDIIVNDSRLNESSYLSGQISYNKSHQKYQFLDLDWFNGSVLNYTLEGCSECGQKVKVVNHLHEERVVLGVHDMEDYAFSEYGGMVQQFQSIIKMHHNGSIHQFAQLPSVLDGETCTIIEYSFLYDFSLSACKDGDEVYLYQTVYSASKPFVMGPYYSSAKHVTSMKLHMDLMIIVDVDER